MQPRPIIVDGHGQVALAIVRTQPADGYLRQPVQVAWRIPGYGLGEGTRSDFSVAAFEESVIPALGFFAPQSPLDAQLHPGHWAAASARHWPSHRMGSTTLIGRTVPRMRDGSRPGEPGRWFWKSLLS